MSDPAPNKKSASYRLASDLVRSENLCEIDAQGWWTGARRVDSPNFNARPKERLPLRLLVIHNISLPPGEFGGGYIERFFCNTLDTSLHPYFQTIDGLRVSAHCLIDRAGDTTQFVSFLDRAWHAGVSQFHGDDNCNDFSIGIELEGTDDLGYSDEQYTALVTLSLALLEHYPDMCIDNILGHSDIAPGRKTDPGVAFDWPRFRAALSNL